MKLTDLLAFVRSADPAARLESTAWGQTLLVTSAFGTDPVLVFNPKPLRVIRPDQPEPDRVLAKVDA